MKEWLGKFFRKSRKSDDSKMTIEELVHLFPEIPKDLHQEPLLGQFAETFADLLRIARDPSACSSQHDASNQFYLKLIGPMKIYMYGLSTKEKVLGQLQDLLDRHAADPGGITDSLLPQNTAESEVKGPACN
ncbi:hypothetical protein MJD09_03925 [bacterium]|nr:hypothetical protein [bacterium]